MVAKNMNDLVSLCKRRGFVFPSGEIYGGLKITIAQNVIFYH